MEHNQVLIVGERDTKKLTIAKDVFGVVNAEGYIDRNSDNPGIIIDSGHLQTKYYEADIGLFIDEIHQDAYNKWIEEFLSDSMKELRDYLSGIIITMRIDELLDHLDAFTELFERISNQLDSEYITMHPESDMFQWQGFKVIVCPFPTRQEEITICEDQLLMTGFDFVVYGDNREGQNSVDGSGELYGESRLHSIVESNRWPVETEFRPSDHVADPDYHARKLMTDLSLLEDAKLEASKIEDPEERRKYADKVIADILKSEN